jgi:hypothetical protein
VEDTYPTLEGLKNTLEIQATFDPRAAKVKLEDFVDLRFVEEMKKAASSPSFTAITSGRG